MHKPPPTYLQIRPGGELPDISRLSPFIAVLAVDEIVDEMWRWEVSRWLVGAGCRYLLAWGKHCESWAESVDDANLEAFDYEDIPADKLVMTTWHEDEELEEVFWFAKNRARHPGLVLGTTIVLHVTQVGKREAIETLYASA